MNITNDWWAACHEDGVSIWSHNALSLESNWHSTPGGDWIGQRNQAGRIAIINNFQTIRFLNTNFLTVAQHDLTASFNNSYGVSACNSNFYTIVNYDVLFTLRQYDDVGTYTTQTWDITGFYERNSGAVLNDSAFYWSNDDTILAWDLNGNVALPNLVTLTNFRVSYIMTTAEGKIAVIWINNDTNRPSKLAVYNTDGSVFAQADYDGADLIGLSKSLNWTNYLLWTSRQEDNGLSRLVLYDYTAGNFNTILSILNVSSAEATNPTRSEFDFFPLVTGNGEAGGMYKLIKDMKHDELWTGEDSYVTVKRPDPFATTALFGDEP